MVAGNENDEQEEAPTREDFARLFLEELQRLPRPQASKYLPESFQIQGSKDQIISLTNYFAEYCRLPPADRAAYLKSVVRVSATADTKIAADFEEAREHLRPKVWLRAALEFSELQMRVRQGSDKRLSTPQYEIGSHLLASLVYDLPESMRSIAEDELSDWGVSYYEALEIARENLQHQPFQIARLGEGLYATATGDSYDGCRLLLPNLLDQLEVRGEMIALVASRDMLLITGSDDDEGLAGMLILAKQAEDDPRPMSLVPIRREGDTWCDWLPPRDHKLYPGFKELATIFLSGLYHQQKELLEALDQKQGNDRFVATYSAIQRDEVGLVETFAVWSEGVVSLLPKTDLLAFFSPERGTLGFGRWEDVERVAGHLLNPTDEYPLRYLVDEFPTQEQIQEMGLVAG